LPLHIGKNAVIRSHSVIYAGSRIGDNFHLAHSGLVREFNEIGNHVSIGVQTIIEHHCKVGNNVRIQAQSGLSEYTVAEDDCWIGPRVVTCNVMHPTCAKAKECIKGPVIKRGVIIGANVVMAPDITIGERSFLCIGAVILKDVRKYQVMFGNPARAISTIFEFDCPFGLVDSPYGKESPDGAVCGSESAVS
jgi:acetyltransferase-like isoleucine patch superfamily enzyme